jgi:hypothetical protein
LNFRFNHLRALFFVPAMSQDHPSIGRIPAPCIVDVGTIVDKRDMQRILADVSRVQYQYFRGDQVIRSGEGCILEVFSDPQSSTLVANQAIYINVLSFDYLELSQMPDGQSCFDLIQEEMSLRLQPMNNPLHSRQARPLNTAALEAVVADVLSASWDAQMDDDDVEGF